MTVPLFTPLITHVDLTDKIDLVGNPPLALPRYDEICRAVREAKTVDEVDEIIGRAEAIRAYAKQARNRQLELDAAEIRLRAERRLGELMQGAGRTIGKAKGGQPYQLTATGLRQNPVGTPTLAEAGIDKNLAHRARSGVAVPEQKFEELLKENRRRGNPRVGLAAVLRAAPDAAPGTETGCGELIAPAAKGLAAENKALSREVTALRQRVAALLRENRSLEDQVKMWKARAEAAGWKETADA
jgi:hypothetical protein